MTGFVIAVANALVAALNDPARPWQAVPVGDAEDKRFVAVRSWGPKYTLEELETFRVTAVPGELSWERASRALDKIGYEVQLGFQKRLSGTDDEIKDQMDALALRVGEVAEWLRKNVRLGTSPEAVLVGLTAMVYSEEHLADRRSFTSLLTLVYQVFV